MLCTEVREELKILVTQACLKHLSLQLWAPQYYRNTPRTQSARKSDGKPAPASRGLTYCNYYQVNPHKSKNFVTVWGVFSFHFLLLYWLKAMP